MVMFWNGMVLNMVGQETVRSVNSLKNVILLNMNV